VRRAGGRGDLGEDVAPRAEAGIDETRRLEPRERGAVVVEMLRLPADGAVPREAEPGEVLENRGVELRPAPRAVDVLDAQEEPAVPRARLTLREQRRVGMPEMQVPARRRGEARDGGQRSSSYGPPRSSARR
jgi:hypothetical protein